MKRAIFILLAFMCLVCPASADEWIAADDVTQYTYSADNTDDVVSAIRFIGIEPGTSFTMQSETSILNVTYTSSNFIFVDTVVKYTDLNNYSVEQWNGSKLYNPVGDNYVSLDSQGWGLTSGTLYGDNDIIEIGGAPMRSNVAPPGSFTFQSNKEITLKYYLMPRQDLNQNKGYAGSVADNAIGMIALVPIIGPFMAQGLTITGGVMALFIRIATIVTGSSVILFLAAEVFILMRATVVAQRSRQATKRISNSIQSIIDDNAALIRFVIDAFTKLLELLYSAVRAVGSWIPFT